MERSGRFEGEPAFGRVVVVPVGWKFQGAVLVLSTVGAYRNEELSQAMSEAMAHPQFRAGTPVLFDGRLSEAQLSPADIEWRLEWISSLRRKGCSPRFAVVVRQEHAFRFGVARQLSLRLEGVASTCRSSPTRRSQRRG